MELEIIHTEGSGFTLRGNLDGLNIGIVHVTVTGEKAEIADIYIGEFELPCFRWLPYFKKKVSYRNKGYGSYLLRYAINLCREMGVHEVTGKMHGDEERLSKWYSSHGFDVADNDISLKLKHYK